MVVIMPIVSENPFKFIQEKMKKWPSPEGAFIMCLRYCPEHVTDI